MRYIKTTFIDVFTRLPVTKTPAKTGPTLKDKYAYVLDVAEARSTNPSVYCATTSETDFEEWEVELTSEQFFDCVKTELKQRASNKRKTKTDEPVLVQEVFYLPSDQGKLATLLTVLTALKSNEKLDFYSQGTWVKLSKTDVKDILTKLHDKTQSSFSWQRDLYEQIDEEDFSKDVSASVNKFLELIG